MERRKYAITETDHRYENGPKLIEKDGLTITADEDELRQIMTAIPIIMEGKGCELPLN